MVDLHTPASPYIQVSRSPYFQIPHLQAPRSPDPQASRSTDLLGSGTSLNISRSPSYRSQSLVDLQISRSSWYRSRSLGGSPYLQISLVAGPLPWCISRRPGSPDLQISRPHISRSTDLQISRSSPDLLDTGAKPLVFLQISRPYWCRSQSLGGPPYLQISVVAEPAPWRISRPQAPDFQISRSYW